MIKDKEKFFKVLKPTLADYDCIMNLSFDSMLVFLRRKGMLE
jgi:hypothetical protein